MEAGRWVVERQSMWYVVRSSSVKSGKNMTWVLLYNLLGWKSTGWHCRESTDENTGMEGQGMRKAGQRERRPPTKKEKKTTPWIIFFCYLDARVQWIFDFGTFVCWKTLSRGVSVFLVWSSKCAQIMVCWSLFNSFPCGYESPCFHSTIFAYLEWTLILTN